MRLIVILALLSTAFGQTTIVNSTPPPDPLKQRVEEIKLADQSVLDGIAMLSDRVGLAVSVEHPLSETIAGKAPRPKRLTAIVGPATVSETLDGLCSLDETFEWQRNGNMINIFPRALTGNAEYFLNRRINILTFQNVGDAREAVFKTAEQLPGPKEQVAVMQVGTPITFPRRWNATFQDTTVRLNFLAVDLTR